MKQKDAVRGVGAASARDIKAGSLKDSKVLALFFPDEAIVYDTHASEKHVVFPPCINMTILLGYYEKMFFFGR
ncbi:MAG: hypothetical protein JW765_10340 [Deltaproteobacteria bacterium]|nr:hypothetical protein [Candidatus Zymogenaceae bacterium]